MDTRATEDLCARLLSVVVRSSQTSNKARCGDLAGGVSTSPSNNRLPDRYTADKHPQNIAPDPLTCVEPVEGAYLRRGDCPKGQMTQGVCLGG